MYFNKKGKGQNKKILKKKLKEQIVIIELYLY